MEYHNKRLSNKWIRYTNYSILVVLAIAYHALEVYDILPPLYILGPIISGLLIGGIRFEGQIKEIKWSEWDSTERERKLWFSHNYTVFCYLFSLLFAYSIAIAAFVIDRTETSWVDGEFVVSGWEESNIGLDLAFVNGYSVLIPPIIFLINICYTISLFFPAFMRWLPSSLVRPKPKDWDRDYFYY